MAGFGPVWAEKDFENFKFSLLEQRQEKWPEWHLPSPFKRSALSDAVIFPEWFAGNWQVFSIDLDDDRKNYIQHMARFKPDDLDRIIADRVFNTESLAREVLREELLYVKEDPNQQNRQLAVFKGENYLETKVLSREQQNNYSDIFLVDEIVMQIHHSPEITKINQVETLGRYKQCNQSKNSLANNQQSWICGEQWQAVYKEPGQDFQSKPIYTNHYQLFFIPFNSKMSLENFLTHLSKGKALSNEGDL